MRKVAFVALAVLGLLVLSTGALFAASPDPAVTGAFADVQDLGSQYIGLGIPVLIALALMWFGVNIVLKIIHKAGAGR